MTFPLRFGNNLRGGGAAVQHSVSRRTVDATADPEPGYPKTMDFELVVTPVTSSACATTKPDSIGVMLVGKSMAVKGGAA
ncbi:hypothetical protein [Mycobacterium sp.]|uniref:hypothetical protein n=1 Tax=Mycobacterium sp. TaxID=1785 RepID=UPI0031E4364B